MALVGDFVRTASVLAEGDVEVVALGDWDFRGMIGKYPSLAVEMLQTLARRLRDLEDQLV
jgi:CRP-like cAMP-binding protein